MELSEVLFTTAMDMINRLIAAEADHSLLKQLNHYYTPDLLVCDEIGYLSLGQQGSHLAALPEPGRRPLIVHLVQTLPDQGGRPAQDTPGQFQVPRR